ncbi:MAG: hypothetical protein ACJ79P_20825 [Myxococcales bacterium]
MKAFSRRGFQLRSAPLETRVAYTGFLILTAPGVVSLAALSFGRMGVSPSAIATYYRGGETEMSFPKQFWQMMEVSHFHLFSVPVVVLILAHLLYATPISVRARVWLTALTFLGALLEIGGPWAVRYVAGGFAVLLLAGWILLAVGIAAIVLVSLISMWGPDRWNEWMAAPEPDEDMDR